MTPLKTLRRLVRPLLVAGFASCALPCYSFQSGFRHITVPGAEPIPVALFYPTTAPAKSVQIGRAWLLDVAMGAPVAPELKGLILLSHGTGGSEIGHHTLAEGLAKDGYLVATLRHPGDNWEDTSMLGKPRYLTERPAQASRVLDALLADAQWASKIQTGRIGALGHWGIRLADLLCCRWRARDQVRARQSNTAKLCKTTTSFAA